MIPAIQSAIESRISVNHFLPGHPLEEGVIAALITQATRAPSAYNLQNWRFIAAQSEQAKARLKALAFGQQKVADASVAFIVCGTMDAHRQLASALQPSVRAKVMQQGMVDSWVAQAHRAHADNPVLQRDEAIRSASLAAMTLMLAAQGMGLGSCAMSGFDAAGIQAEFGLGETELPVMIVAVGYAAPGNWPQKPRKALSEVLSLA